MRSRVGADGLPWTYLSAGRGCTQAALLYQGGARATLGVSLMVVGATLLVEGALEVLTRVDV